MTKALPNFRSAPRHKSPEFSPADAVRHIVDNSDVLGRDADGNVWLLASCNLALFEYLMAFESDEREDTDEDGGFPGGHITEDDEDNGDAEDCETGDCGEDDARNLPPAPTDPDYSRAAQDGTLHLLRVELVKAALAGGGAR
jgi:hypothetical protein